MNIKKIVKISVGVLLSILLITIIITAIPRVSNPSPAYQTDLKYGPPVSQEISAILTPKVAPDRDRAIIVLENENIVFEYGPTDKIMNTASVRKSLIGLLYGIAVYKNLIDINKTLQELNIDEYTRLTKEEKSATIQDLLMAKSGVYLPSQGEHDAQITHRPERGSHTPGSYFFMNNFDANVLGTIFTQETGVSLGVFMEEHLAKPLAMQDFSEDNVIIGDPWFWPKKKSMHKQYCMYLSTRDLARIGAMVANNGRWNEKQVVPADWIKKSITAHSDLRDNHLDYGRYDGFGYQWWLASDTKEVRADGYGGKFLLIYPEENRTIVEQNFSGNSLLSTGLWLINKKRDSGINDLLIAHRMMSQTDSIHY